MQCPLSGRTAVLLSFLKVALEVLSVALAACAVRRERAHLERRALVPRHDLRPPALEDVQKNGAVGGLLTAVCSYIFFSIHSIILHPVGPARARHVARLVR